MQIYICNYKCCNPVLVDTFVAECMGYDKNQIPYIEIAEQIGVGGSNLDKANAHELNNDSSDKKIMRLRTVENLAKYIEEKDACSACYGSLIHAFARMDEEGNLRKLKEEIQIGQDHKLLKYEGIGVAMCTKKCEFNVPGCPTKAKYIITY